MQQPFKIVGGNKNLKVAINQGWMPGEEMMKLESRWFMVFDGTGETSTEQQGSRGNVQKEARHVSICNSPLHHTNTPPTLLLNSFLTVGYPRLTISSLLSVKMKNSWPNNCYVFIYIKMWMKMCVCVCVCSTQD